MATTDCPECEFTTDSEKGLKIHYSKVHGGEYPWDANSPYTPTTCEQCGEEYKAKRSRVDRSRFCSVECRNRWQESSAEWSETIAGHTKVSDDDLLHDLQEVGRRLGRAPTKQEIDRHSSHLGETYINRFESLEVARRLAGLPSTPKGGECQDCNLEFPTLRGLRIHVTRTHDRQGSDGDHYLGAWETQREKRIQQDNEECVDCGLSREEHHQQYGEDLHVHHKKSYRSFDDPVAANAQSNLVTLCKSCHAARERQNSQ